MSLSSRRVTPIQKSIDGRKAIFTFDCPFCHERVAQVVLFPDEKSIPSVLELGCPSCLRDDVLLDLT